MQKLHAWHAQGGETGRLNGKPTSYAHQVGDKKKSISSEMKLIQHSSLTNTSGHLQQDPRRSRDFPHVKQCLSSLHGRNFYEKLAATSSRDSAPILMRSGN